MTVLQVRDGHHGDVVGEVHVDGTLETDDADLRERYDDLVETTDDGTVAAPYTYPQVDDDGVRSTVTMYVGAGDPHFLTAVKQGLGGTWVGRADDDLPAIDPESYDGVPLSAVRPGLAALIESAEDG